VKHNQSKIYLIISNRAIPKTTTQKTINMSNRDLNKKPGVKAGTRDALAVAVSYKTPTYYCYSSSVKVMSVIEEIQA
jgi:hypothetical protein